MPDDLSSIEGLADKHVRALNRQYVTGLRELVQADPEVIYRAMASLRPRPTREQVARWQDDASNQLDEMAPDPAAWQTAASFVVVFSQRRKDEIWERRVEAERTEVEPERTMQVWSGWERRAGLCLDSSASSGSGHVPPGRRRPRRAPGAARPPPPPGLNCVSTPPCSSTRPGGRTW